MASYHDSLDAERQAYLRRRVPEPNMDASGRQPTFYFPEKTPSYLRTPTWVSSASLPTSTTGQARTETVGATVNDERMEDELYRRKAFRIWLWFALAGVLGGVTYGAVQGYPI